MKRLETKISITNGNFVLNRHTKIDAGPILNYFSENVYESQAIERALLRMGRDLDATLSIHGPVVENQILIMQDQENLLKQQAEQFCIQLINPRCMHIIAVDALGVIYALLKISECYLKIPPYYVA